MALGSIIPPPAGASAPGGGTSLAVDDEGVETVDVTLRLDFVGAGVNVTEGAPGTAVVEVSGAALTNEQIQDIVGALVAASGGLLTVTYDDAGDALTIGLTTEVVQDAIGALLTDNAVTDVVYDDAGNALTITLMAGAVANSMLANMAESRVKGRAAGAGTGVPTDLTPAQLRAIAEVDVDGGAALVGFDDSGLIVITGVSNIQTALAAVDAALAAPSAAFAPIVYKRSDGALTLTPAVANTWYECQGAQGENVGSAAARPGDLVVPDVVAGQWVDLSISGSLTSAAGSMTFDMFTIVSGASTGNHVGPTATAGPTPWLCAASVAVVVQPGVLSYQIQAGDIEGGDVRFRPYFRSTGTTARAFAGTGGFEWRWAARGPFG